MIQSVPCNAVIDVTLWHAYRDAITKQSSHQAASALTNRVSPHRAEHQQHGEINKPDTLEHQSGPKAAPARAEHHGRMNKHVTVEHHSTPKSFLTAVHAKQNVGPGIHMSHAAASPNATAEPRLQQSKKGAAQGLQNMLLQYAATYSKDKRGDASRNVSSDKSAQQPVQAVNPQNPPAKVGDGQRQQSLDMQRRAAKQSLPMQSRSASPNSYLARSGRAASQSRPAAKSGNTAAIRSACAPRIQQPRASHVTRSDAEPPPHGKAAARKGQASSAAAVPVQGKARAAQPSFIQTLRDWGLGPTSSGPLTQPMWQPYNRHVTPERDSSRSALARRALAEKAQALQRLNDSSASGLSSGLAARTQQPQVKLSTHQAHSPAQAWELRQRANWDSTGRSSIAAVTDNVPLCNHQQNSGSRAARNSCTQDTSASRSRSMERQASVKTPSDDDAAGVQNPSNHDTQEPVFHPSPLKPSTSRLWGRSSSPAASQHQVSQATVPAASSEKKKTQNRALPVQSEAKPYRAGHWASAALQTKQDAWEHTRTHRLPSLLSQVTELLRCNSEPLLLAPERSATELMCAAAPQLGQQMPLPATVAARGSYTAGHQVEEVATAGASNADTAEDQEEEDATAVADFGQGVPTWDQKDDSYGHILPGTLSSHLDSRSCNTVEAGFQALVQYLHGALTAYDLCHCCHSHPSTHSTWF